MNPAHSTRKHVLDDDSEGEEEVISTWKVTNSGKITVVQKANDSKQTPNRSTAKLAPMKTKPVSTPLEPAPGLNSQRNIRPKQSISPRTSGQRPQVAATIASRPAPASAPASAPKPAAMKAIWYLGGNHVVKLLTSVDGDLDPGVLSKLEAVPSVVGELALSVESLVSDDFTVGGFESDLLAKIAANTLAAKRASVTLAPKASPVSQAQHKTVAAAPQARSQPKSVPNPLAVQNPVPNPLARITPPGSPSTFNSDNTNKRKSPGSANAMPMRKTKTARSEAQTPLIQAR